MPTLLTSVDSLVEVFKGHADTDKSFDFLKYRDKKIIQPLPPQLQCHCRAYDSFTMESIFAAALGRHIEIQKGQSSSLTEATVSIFKLFQENKTFSHIYLFTIFSERPKWHIFLIIICESQAIFRGLFPSSTSLEDSPPWQSITVF